MSFFCAKLISELNTCSREVKLRRAGFSIPEALVGIAITVIVIASGSQVLSSLSTSFKKAKALNSIQKIQSLGRSGVFFKKTIATFKS